MKEAKDLSIKTHIMNAATELFAENGFEGTSVREIASQAKVNVAMVSYYFGSKEGLYLSCISSFAESKTEILKQMLRAPQTAEEFQIRFKLFVENKMKSYEQDLCAHKIITREMQTARDPEFHEKVMHHLMPVFRTLQNFFQSGIDGGILRQDLNSEHLTILLMGIMRNTNYCGLHENNIMLPSFATHPKNCPQKHHFRGALYGCPWW